MKSKKEIKIGILTLYYNNFNYGGALQAYALCKYIRIMGYRVEQITYEKKNRASVSQIISYLQFASLESTYKRGLQLAKKVFFYKKNTEIEKILEYRRELFSQFLNNKIPHSMIYNKETIRNSLDVYTAFICGSDQIWNQNGKDLAYFLDFVPENICKISYAASVGKSKLTKKQYEFMLPKIERLDFISVREKEAKNLFENKIKKEISVTLDPTFLLDIKEWNRIERETFIKEPYLFVYLLGNNKEQRIKIKEYARLLDLKLVFLPYVHFEYEVNEVEFADIDLYDVGPSEFIGLIKRAEMIITDSFHGCVFSIIYNKKFWALKRYKDSKKGNMNSRLYTLFENLGLESRMIEVKDSFNGQELNMDINYRMIEKKLEKLRRNSKSFLEDSLFKVSG